MSVPVAASPDQDGVLSRQNAKDRGCSIPAEGGSGQRIVRLLVYGGRDYPAGDAYNWLERYAADEVRDVLKCTDARIGVLIEGGADGADRGAWEWGRDKHIALLRFPARWDQYGKSAGPRRNQLMLNQGRPDIAIEFPGGRGTADMAKRLEMARIPIILAKPKQAAADAKNRRQTAAQQIPQP